MKKTSKILSLLVALCMTFSMFMGITAMAADLELVSFNADSDFITLDFNQEVDAENAVIILTKNGEAVENFTFGKKDYKPAVQTASSTNYTYFVTPAEGIEIDAEYKLTLHEVKSADGTATFGPWAKTFTVTPVEGNMIPYRTINGQTVTYDTSVEGQVTASLSTFTTSYTEKHNAFIGTQIGADYESAVPMTNASTTSGLWTEKDVTIKLKIAISGATRENVFFGIADNVNRVGYKAFTGTYMHLQRIAGNTANANFYLREDRINADTTFTGSKALDGSNRPGSLTYSDLDLKISTKDQLAHAFIENQKVADMNLSADAKGWAFVSIEAIEKASGSSALVATVSDLYITRATFADATPDVPGVEPEPEPEPEEPANPAIVADWDADLDFVTVDFTEDIGTLNATLTQAGTQVPVTVSKANHANMEAARAERYTYIIKPVTGGLTRDLPYTLTLANVQGEEDIKAWSKTFKVEVIAEGTDLTNAQWNKRLNNNGTSAVANNAAGEIEIPYTSSSSYALIGRAVGTDAAANASVAEKDYTVKVTYSDDAATTHANWRMGISNSPSYRDNGAGFRGVWLSGQIQPNGKTNMTFNERWSNDNIETKTQSGANIEIDREEGYELKVSVKNQFARAFVDGGKVADLALQQDYPGYVYISNAPAGSFSNGATTHTATVKNFVATRAVPVLEEVVEFTVGEATVTGSFASGTVSIAATLNNTTAAAKNIFAVCALYDATDAMKNIVISPVGSIANTGETTLEFNGVATNGATKAKIFIWDSAAALNPWFPAIIAE